MSAAGQLPTRDEALIRTKGKKKNSPRPNEVNGRTKIAAREQRNGENPGGGGWLECRASIVVKVRYSR